MAPAAVSEITALRLTRDVRCCQRREATRSGVKVEPPSGARRRGRSVGRDLREDKGKGICVRFLFTGWSKRVGGAVVLVARLFSDAFEAEEPMLKRTTVFWTGQNSNP